MKHGHFLNKGYKHWLRKVSDTVNEMQTRACMFVWVCPEKPQWEVANYIYMYAHVHVCTFERN